MWGDDVFGTSVGKCVFSVIQFDVGDQCSTVIIIVWITECFYCACGILNVDDVLYVICYVCI